MFNVKYQFSQKLGLQNYRLYRLVSRLYGNITGFANRPCGSGGVKAFIENDKNEILQIFLPELKDMISLNII